MHIDLTGRTALITGSTLGIGYAIAKGLYDSGASVVLNSRNAERVDAAVERLAAGDDDGRVQGIVADVGSGAGCAILIDAVPNVDILVNNAGAFGPQDFLDVPDEKWERLFQINVMAGVRLSRHYLPHMMEQNWGRLIFVSSVDAVQVPPNMVDYGATKVAQIAVSRGIAHSVRGTNITSNALLVGPTHSDGFEGFMGFSEYTGGAVIPPGPPIAPTFDQATEMLLASEMYSGSIIDRMASCEEVANMAVYLASEQASITTGAAMRVEGGVVRSTI